MRADTALISLCISLIILIILSQRVYIKIQKPEKTVITVGFTLLEYSLTINKTPKLSISDGGRNVKALFKSIGILRKGFHVRIGFSPPNGFSLLCECRLFRLIIFSLSVLYYKIIGSIKKGVKNV